VGQARPRATGLDHIEYAVDHLPEPDRPPSPGLSVGLGLGQVGLELFPAVLSDMAWILSSFCFVLNSTHWGEPEIGHFNINPFEYFSLLLPF